MSAQELEKDMDEKTYAGVSMPLTKFSKRVEMLMQRHRCTGIGINQIRDNLNSTWGGITTPGGKAWKHCCAVRLQFSRGQFIDEKGNALTRGAENPAGNVVLMSMVKNKTCPPTRRTGFYTLNYLTGIDYLKDLVDVAIKYGIIDKRGAWFNIVDIETGVVMAEKIHGQADVYSYLQDHKEVLDFVKEIINKKIFEEN